MLAAGAPSDPGVVVVVSMWPAALMAAFSLGVLLGAWFASRASVSPSGGGPGWGGPPGGRLDPPGPMGDGAGQPSWIDEVERFLASLPYERLACGTRASPRSSSAPRVGTL